MIHYIKSKLILALACLLIGMPLYAQELAGTVAGTVLNEFGQPLAGVTILSENGKNGTSTNIKGEFTVTIDDGSRALVFSLYGYGNEKVALSEKQEMAVRLKWDAHFKDEVVQLGYTSQLRSELSGAVSTVKGEELEKSPVANLTQTLAGRLSGLTTQEAFSELSRATTNLSIRGLSAARTNGPLVIIDGIINAYNSNQTLEYITANEIESITVLKDASTQALYGIQGANGLLVITTKRGRRGLCR